MAVAAALTGAAALASQALAANDLFLVSRASGASGEQGNGGSSSPSISSDGRFGAFSSGASNLHPADADTTSDVFVRDL